MMNLARQLRHASNLNSFLEGVLGMFRPGGPEFALRHVVIKRLPLDHLTFRGGSKNVVLLLDRSLALEKEITLPVAVRNKAYDAIGLKLKTTLPMQGRALRWTHLRVPSEGNFDTYQVLIYKQEFLDAVIEQARQAGIKPRRISVEGAETPLWDSEPKSQGNKRFWAGASFLLITILATGHAIFLGMRMSGLEHELEARQSRIAALQSRIEDAQSRMGERNAHEDIVNDQIRKFNAQSRPLTLLSAMGRDLPEGVWLSELSVLSDSIRLSGFSTADVMSVIRSLQALDWVSDVRLEGPVSEESHTGQKRFDLRLRYLPNGYDR
ncbi:PilN domain-containing protein [Roseinatronobacter alkalisoli]|uniref:PilN domain-containing protein n=1 Tax=Roseinatronobacter alkalisoli TaxID=3028235 RepID=A0ABT5TF16_9RHOB|nr:PilN domain-containing protein [Roseinatronobacter sp. HJB301]MDD7973709.1 PilN domain-containing protein [Roseinatronobacter sp. HJB301]